MKADISRDPMIDVIKVVASQLIIWHHLAFYGPMSDVVYPHAPRLIDWLYDDARIAVQAFLVVGGFLAAKSLLPHFETSGDTMPQRSLLSLIWQRYTRLVSPYLVALLAALAAAAVARQLIDHPAVPQAASPGQLLAHVFLLQDIVDADALSAGVWYVAIDFQLYALLLLVLWSARKLADLSGTPPSWLLLAMCLGLTVISLLWFNRYPALDEWALYFFGAYGLGILSQWISRQPCRGRGMILLTCLVALALIVEWRSRALVAGLTALLLIMGSGRTPAWMSRQWLAVLGKMSYSVFLIHYPVCLLVGALVFSLWPHSLVVNGIGMVAAWLLSLGAGFVLYRLVEEAGFAKLAARLAAK